MAATARWEHGSDFHLSLDGGTLEAPWLDRRHTLWGSGRDALRALLAWGRERHGWTRLWAPTFFCQEVLAGLAAELPIVLYRDAPTDAGPARLEAGPHDVVLLANVYGIRRELRVETQAVVVEDHTHDPVGPCAFASRADYAAASLRKTLPLPDGGVLWSPAGRALPPEMPPTSDHLAMAMHRLAAMVLKLQYLEGSPVDKAAMRESFIESERAIGRGAVSGISPFSRERLQSVPARRWRSIRTRNMACFRELVGHAPGFRLLDAPFAATLLFQSSSLRERVRRRLIAESIYPAVLWPLESPIASGIPMDHIDLSRRLLTLHCDFRYGDADMERVAERVAASCEDAPETVRQASGRAGRTPYGRTGRPPGA